MSKEAINKIITSFLIGLGTSILISVAFLIIVIGQIYFMTRGVGYMINPQSYNVVSFCTIAFFIALLITIAVHILKKDKAKAIGRALPSLFWIAVLFFFGYVSFVKDTYYKPFNKEEWMKNDRKPVEMARELARSNELIGLTQEEIIEKLGVGKLSSNGETLTYMTTNAYGLRLILTLKENKVTESNIFMESFGPSHCYIKNVKYGEKIFYAEFDGLMDSDIIYLYDNGLFRIDMPALSANGTFHLNGDTIFLDYYKFRGTYCQAFTIENNMVFELIKIDGQWMRNNIYMAIYENKLDDYKNKQNQTCLNYAVAKK